MKQSQLVLFYFLKVTLQIVFVPIIFFPSLRIASENGLSYSTLQQDAEIYPNLGFGVGAIASLTK